MKLQQNFTDNNSIKYTCILILIAFAFSILCRLYWVAWASEFYEFFFNDQLMITTNDGYAFAEGARDMIAGFHQPNDLSYFGSSLSTLTYWLYSILPFSFESIIVYMSTFFASLIVVPIILIAREYKFTTYGFIAALLGSIANSYYNRTMSGYYDTDMLVLVLPMLILLTFIRLTINKDIFTLLLSPVFIMIYLWWYPSSYSLNFAMIGLFGLYTLVFHRKEKIFYLAIALMIIALSMLAWQYKLALIVLLFAIFAFKEEKINFYIIWGLVFGSVLILFLSGGLDPVLYQLKFYVFKASDVQNLKDATFIYFNVNETIMEVNTIDPEVFMQRISSSVLVFILSFMGFILLCKDHKSMLLALPMLALGFVALIAGLRFTIYAVPVMALGFGYFVYTFFNFLEKKQIKLSLRNKNILLILITFFSISPALMHIYYYKSSTVFTSYEASILNDLKNKTQREDYVVAWWDYGYPIRYYSDVKTLIDGGKHLGKDNFFSSFVLSKEQIPAANMARLSVEYTEKSFKENYPDVLKAMVKDYNKTSAKDFLESLNDKDFKFDTNKTRDVYIYMPYRMLRIMPVVAQFANTNPDNGEQEKSLFFSQANAIAQDKTTGSVMLDNGVEIINDFRALKVEGASIPLKAFVDIESITNGKFYYNEIDSKAQIYLLFLREYKSFVILDESLYNSSYIQMFLLNQYDQDLFEQITNDTRAKIYRLKR
ncbi:undecaprenyl-diphosphooligosaccharide--protein glycotransferase [Campylobacter lari]|uniref:undecaprenyl-diphosphooligosaccharide--protein glycotransferase n=1 Tax=Campylobacter lari TaxID=201 RepID=UPI001C7343C8|nr:STT3 domain-containing protein [Campylobacter lari]MBX1105005.1 peptide-binding protein [Campylobacter lari]MBX1369138.1 peptide-binding protein [Campylobacter lari]MBX1415460.1 peptide-binding protein [Campylobacter lari]MBX2093944.1 peptide-binding protein [Campylobacter lari]MBX2497419.1 peptide-binding protein [Campylobacter lari]